MDEHLAQCCAFLVRRMEIYQSNNGIDSVLPEILVDESQVLILQSLLPHVLDAMREGSPRFDSFTQLLVESFFEAHCEELCPEEIPLRNVATQHVLGVLSMAPSPLNAMILASDKSSEFSHLSFHGALKGVAEAIVTGVRTGARFTFGEPRIDRFFWELWRELASSQ